MLFLIILVVTACFNGLRISTVVIAAIIYILLNAILGVFLSDFK